MYSSKIGGPEAEGAAKEAKACCNTQDASLLEQSVRAASHFPVPHTAASLTPSPRPLPKPRPSNWSAVTSRAKTLHSLEHRSSAGARSAPLQPLTTLRNHGGFCRPPPKPKPSPSPRGAYATYPSLSVSGSAAEEGQSACTSSKSGASHPAPIIGRLVHCLLRMFGRCPNQVSGPSSSTRRNRGRDPSEWSSTSPYIRNSGSKHYIFFVSFAF